MAGGRRPVVCKHGSSRFCPSATAREYRPGLLRVLRGLVFSVNVQEKIGIVGLTGAGTSSLIVALMRLTELDSDNIVIDGMDISKIGLHDLCAKIAITSREAVLFPGSMRSTSLKRVQLDKAVSSLEDAMDEKGSNFTVGKRQLLSIAWALLKRSKATIKH